MFVVIACDVFHVCADRLWCFPCFCDPCRWNGDPDSLQQQRWVVRCPQPLQSGRLGAQQLHRASKQRGQVLLVSRPHFQKCFWVLAQLRHQWQLPGAGEWEQSRSKVNICPVWGKGLPLQDQWGLGCQGTSLSPFLLSVSVDLYMFISSLGVNRSLSVSLFCHCQ